MVGEHSDFEVRIATVTLRPRDEHALTDLTRNQPHLHTPTQDIAVAPCPFLSEEADASQQCLYIADTGSNFGSHQILVYVVREPPLSQSRGILDRKVSPTDVTAIFAVDYEAGTHGKKVPNVEAMVTGRGRFWLIEKTFADHGEGPAKIYQSPSLTSYTTFVKENRHAHVLERCTRNATIGGGRESGARAGGWSCADVLRYPPSGASLLEAPKPDMHHMTIHHVHMDLVREIPNPYPDCRKVALFDEEEGEEAALWETFEHETSALPLCPSRRERAPKDHSCRDQARWGKCNDDWIKRDGLCAITCRRCRPPKRDSGAPEEGAIAIRSAEELTPWDALEDSCNETKADLRNVRNIAGADLHENGRRLLIGTYGGIFEYALEHPFNFTSLRYSRQVSTVNRDGTNADTGKYWAGQEGVCYDYTGWHAHDGEGGVGASGRARDGTHIFSVSEHHEGIYHIACNATIEDAAAKTQSNNE